jgi:hypothetical protein
MESRRSLLQGIVDYAGLFPPTEASMADAVAEYARQRQAAESWMLSTFVVSAARLDELANEAADLLPEDGSGDAWPLSVLVASAGDEVLGLIVEFFAGHAPGTRAGQLELGALEWKPDEPAAIPEFLERAPAAEIFCELPWHEELPPWLDALAGTGARAKIRCGGVKPDLIPPVEAVANFLRSCDRASVGMKFTAGLHHPVRSIHRLSYEPDAPRAMMHGFLNVFFAASLVARGDCPDPVLLAVLQETDGSAFNVDATGIAWRDHRVEASVVSDARASLARSFGSCSFAEPVEDLQNLGIL